MGTGDSLGDRKPEAGSIVPGSEERLAQPPQDASLYAAAVIADAQVQRGITPIQMNLQTTCATAGLQGVLDRLSSAPTSVSRLQRSSPPCASFCQRTATSPVSAPPPREERQQLGWGHAVVQRQIAPGEHQHVANLVLQLVQARFQTTGETLLLLLAQATLLEVAGIQQRGGKRCANLMG